MKLIDQRTKAIMEECKAKARAAGLKFDNDTLEYIVTNKDLLELSPKVMIPTLYDYWAHDVGVLQKKGEYEILPYNPYETVINTRPAISFYNDNNPDWLNVMIFYHVLGHIDFFQNNTFFKNTWNDDFRGKALSDKRLMAKLRSEKGRWVDYVIEFTRGIDNLVGYFSELTDLNSPESVFESKRSEFYFNVFIQETKKLSLSENLKELELYNATMKKYPDAGEKVFFSEVQKKFPEFEAIFKKESKKRDDRRQDLLEYIMENSEFLNKEENKWMKSVMSIVRDTSMYFQPQIRSNIINEGWASYWHNKLFMQDERMKGHETDFALVNSKIMSLPEIGLNPYALGWRLLMHIEELAEKGKISQEFQRITDINQRKEYDKKTGKGQEFLFNVRENFNNFLFIDSFIDQEFVDKYNLFVTGRRINLLENKLQHYIRSRKAEDYKKMIIDKLYHPPHITKTTENDNVLSLNHHFEGKPLYNKFIPMTMTGIGFLWGDSIKLETSEVYEKFLAKLQRDLQAELYKTGVLDIDEFLDKQEVKYRRVLYTMKDKKLSKKYLD